MTSGAATIDYSTYSNGGRTTNWGETVATDTVSTTGTGSTQSFTVYGRVPTQMSLAPRTVICNRLIRLRDKLSKASTTVTARSDDDGAASFR